MDNVNINTSQNVLINYELAGIGDRILAQIIDAVIIFCYYFLAIIIFMGSAALFQFSHITWQLTLLTAPALFYHLLFETFMQGQTPGKRYVNIKVVKLDGTQAGVGNYFLRWLLSIIDFVLYGAVAMLCYVLTRKGQRLGDIAGGTTVIKQTNTADFLSNHNPKRFENYVPVFFQAEDLEKAHAELIRNVLKTHSRAHIHAMAKKTRQLLNIPASDIADPKFLMIVLKDYEYFNSLE